MDNASNSNEVVAGVLPYLEIAIEPQLQLKQLELNQAQRLFELTDLDREKLQQWLPWPQHTHSAEDSREFIEIVTEKRRKGEEYGYGIELNGELVGHISLMHVKDERDPEIGYWISSLAEGRGVTTKAATALTSFGFNTLGLQRIIIRAHPDNIGSNKVAEKSGYAFERETEGEDGLVNIWMIQKDR